LKKAILFSFFYFVLLLSEVVFSGCEKLRFLAAENMRGVFIGEDLSKNYTLIDLGGNGGALYRFKTDRGERVEKYYNSVSEEENDYTAFELLHRYFPRQKSFHVSTMKRIEWSDSEAEKNDLIKSGKLSAKRIPVQMTPVQGRSVQSILHQSQFDRHHLRLRLKYAEFLELIHEEFIEALKDSSLKVSDILYFHADLLYFSVQGLFQGKNIDIKYYLHQGNFVLDGEGSLWLVDPS